MKKFENPKGAFLMIESPEDKIEAFVYAIKMQMEHDGHIVTPEFEIAIQKRVEEDQRKIDIEMDKKGVPDVFQTMLGLDRKKDISKFLESQTLTMSELSLFVRNHSQLGLKYKHFKKEFRPEQLEVNNEDIKKLADESKQGLKVRKKIIQRFKQRKIINVHLFEKGDSWYCIFFDYNDITDMHKPNHWAEGNHVHFISHHWSLSLEDVWKSFESKKLSLPKLHIRYTEEEFL